MLGRLDTTRFGIVLALVVGWLHVGCASESLTPPATPTPRASAVAAEVWEVAVRVEHTPPDRASRSETSYTASLLLSPGAREHEWTAALQLLTLDGREVAALGPDAQAAASVQVVMAPDGRIEALAFDTVGNLEATVPLALLVREWATVRELERLDPETAYPGYGGVGPVEVDGESWSRPAYAQTPHVASAPVTVVRSQGTRTLDGGRMVAVRVEESVRGSDGEQVAWTIVLTRSATAAPDTAGVSAVWRSVSPTSPLPEVIAYGQDVAAASVVSGPQLLADLQTALSSGMMPTVHEWIYPAGARLRLEPELMEILVRQTLAGMDTAIRPGLAKVVDALIEAGTPEAQRALRSLLDAPAFRAHPSAASVTQHLAMLKSPTDETIAWALARATTDPERSQRLAAVTVSASAAHRRREGGDDDAANAIGRQLAEGYDRLEGSDDQAAWMLGMGNSGFAGNVERAEAAMASPSVELRTAAVRAVRRVRTSEAEALLLRALDDPSDRVLDRTLESLSDRGLGAEERDALIARLQTDGVRAPVIPWLLRTSRDAEVSPALCALVADVPTASVLQRHQAGWQLLQSRCADAAPRFAQP